MEEGNSLITQERNCREYANKHEFNVVEIFIERGESAKTAERTELQKLLNYCAVKSHGVAVVIIYKIDRLSRNTDDYSQLRILLRSYGVEIRSTSEFFENTPAGRFMENIIANVAQFDNDVRTERSVGGMKQAVLEGRYVWSAPIGYSNSKVLNKSNIVPNEKAPLVLQAFTEVAEGIFSIEEVRQRMAEVGLCKKAGGAITKSNFYRMLTSRIYAGVITTFGLRVQGAFEPIISEVLFDRVQQRIRSKKVSRTYLVENPDFPLRRFVHATSGEKLTGAWAQGKLKKYPYYRFQIEKQTYSKWFLDTTFAAFMEENSISLRYLNAVRIIIKDLATKHSNKKKAKNEYLDTRSAELTNKKGLLIEKNLSGVISDAILRQQLETVERELWKIQRIKERQNSSLIGVVKLLDQVEPYLARPGTEWTKLPFEIKKKFQVFVFPQGVILSKGKFRTPEINNVYKLKEIFSDRLSLNVGSEPLYYKHPKSAHFPPSSEKEFITLIQTIEPELRDLVEIIGTKQKK